MMGNVVAGTLVAGLPPDVRDDSYFVDWPFTCVVLSPIASLGLLKRLIGSLFPFEGLKGEEGSCGGGREWKRRPC